MCISYCGCSCSKIENPNVSEFRKGSIDTTINILDCLDLVQKNQNIN